MSDPIKIVQRWVEGEPKAQPRARAFSRGGKARMYDPGTANFWKRLVAHELRSHRPDVPISTPVLMTMEFYLPRPQRLMRAKDPSCPLPAKGKPDIDNLEKAVMDALTDDGWWTDDSIVVACSASKLFHAKGASPGMQISIWALDEESVITFQ